MEIDSPQKYVTETVTGSYGSEEHIALDRIHNSTGHKESYWDVPAGYKVTKVGGLNGYKYGTSKVTAEGYYADGSSKLFLNGAGIAHWETNSKLKTYTLTDSDRNGLVKIRMKIYHGDSNETNDCNLVSQIYYQKASVSTTSSWKPY